MPHNIQAIANSFITVNKYSELLRKVRFSYNFSKSVHYVCLIVVLLAHWIKYNHDKAFMGSKYLPRVIWTHFQGIFYAVFTKFVCFAYFHFCAAHPFRLISVRWILFFQTLLQEATCYRHKENGWLRWVEWISVLDPSLEIGYYLFIRDKLLDLVPSMFCYRCKTFALDVSFC